MISRVPPDLTRGMVAGARKQNNSLFKNPILKLVRHGKATTFCDLFSTVQPTKQKDFIALCHRQWCSFGFMRIPRTSAKETKGRCPVRHPGPGRGCLLEFLGPRRGGECCEV